MTTVPTPAGLSVGLALKYDAWDRLAEVVWRKTQQVDQNEDGTLDFRVKVSGLGEISWWVLGYGDQAEVLQPPQLGQIIAERAAGMAQKYGA